MPQFCVVQPVHVNHPNRKQSGFTLIEVLASLGLCALLATATASAIAFAARAELVASRDGAASLFVPALYAAQRLRPDTPLEVPGGWRVERTSAFAPLPNGDLCEWHLIAIAAHGHDIPPFTLRILDDTP
jgi:prepilin-type N-terminal cleavage/methylation domain-containing protein